MARHSGEVSRASGFAPSSLAVLAFARAWLLPVCVGLVAVTLPNVVRLPVQLPGHNALFWMAGIVAGRIASGNALGGIAGGLGAVVGSVGADGSAALGFAAAGALVDGLAATARWLRVGWTALAGLLGNLAILGVKLLVALPPAGAASRGLGTAIESYAAFGAIGGLIGGSAMAAAIAARKARRAG